MVGFIQVIPYSRMFLSIPSDLASVPDMLFLHFGEQFLRFFFVFFLFVFLAAPWGRWDPSFPTRK